MHLYEHIGLRSINVLLARWLKPAVHCCLLRGSLIGGECDWCSILTLYLGEDDSLAQLLAYRQ